jgi:aspartyl-tRNA(Asn)/glutamyl-tRNA(Gln) amidotransferase subunit C
MSIDDQTVRKVARLARVAVADKDVAPLRDDLNRILAWVEELNEVDVDGVEPMTSVTPMSLKMREDVITAGGDAGAALSNAPETAEGFFVVPKVIE